ncbi:GNAT family N-acetyltransferase [Alteromonadaceae bacterium BrNp21-10]|nr:GNAT family N-acetyltransferase [Alteromonadaceae bacterium BrNp21-10]
MPIISTQRLILEEISVDDAEFILRLFNDPLCIRHIGDKNLSSIADARRYIIDSPQRSYIENGVGLLLMRDKSTMSPLGLCGLLKRDYLKHLDLGYALLDIYRRQGFASEAAQASLVYAKQNGVDIVQALVSPQNQRSIELLLSLGFIMDDGQRPPNFPDNTLLFSYAI